jgi:hypothetical protein
VRLAVLYNDVFKNLCSVLVSNYYFSPQIAKVSKYDQYIKDFLLKNSELSIEKIGTFVLTGHVTEVLHPQSISFTANKRAQTSEGLITFIVAETGKSKTLITSDLSSLFEEARQFANLGKPFSVAGLGTIALNRAGEYEFAPAAGNVPGSEHVYTIKQAGETAGKTQAGRNVVVFIAFVIIILVAAGLGWGIYKYMNMNKAETPASGVPAADSVKIATAADTAAVVTAQKPQAEINGDSTYYKFIFETTTSRQRAYRRNDSLKAWGEHALLDSIKGDSNTFYHLYVRIKLPAKDTSFVKDSLQKYFARPNPIRIERN